MTPQEIAKSIADELREYPERWTQRAFSRDWNGCPSSTRNADAVSWCTAGHIIKRVPQEDRRLLDEALIAFNSALSNDTLMSWNDFTGRTVAEVIGLCDKVAGAQS